MSSSRFCLLCQLTMVLRFCCCVVEVLSSKVTASLPLRCRIWATLETALRADGASHVFSVSATDGYLHGQVPSRLGRGRTSVWCIDRSACGSNRPAQHNGQWCAR